MHMQTFQLAHWLRTRQTGEKKYQRFNSESEEECEKQKHPTKKTTYLKSGFQKRI